MKIKLSSLSSAAALCAVVLTFTSTSQAGPFGGFRGIDGGTTHANRDHRIDDPANHDVLDDRGGNQLGDDRRRHHGRHHGGADDPANHNLGDDHGGNQPGDDHGRHHGRGGH